MQVLRHLLSTQQHSRATTVDTEKKGRGSGFAVHFQLSVSKSVATTGTTVCVGRTNDGRRSKIAVVAALEAAQLLWLPLSDMKHAHKGFGDTGVSVCCVLSLSLAWSTGSSHCTLQPVKELGPGPEPCTAPTDKAEEKDESDVESAQGHLWGGSSGGGRRCCWCCVRGRVCLNRWHSDFSLFLAESMWPCPAGLAFPVEEATRVSMDMRRCLIHDFLCARRKLITQAARFP